MQMSSAPGLPYQEVAVCDQLPSTSLRLQALLGLLAPRPHFLPLAFHLGAQLP